MKALMSKWIIKALRTPMKVKPSNDPKVLHYIVATFLPWSMGSLLLVDFLPKLLNQRWIQSVAPHYSIMEGDGKHGCIPFSFNCKGYSATQSLVEDQGLYFGITMGRASTSYMKGLRYSKDIWDPKRYVFLNWEVAKVIFSLEEFTMSYGLN
jgi:hypothetical protein